MFVYSPSCKYITLPSPEREHHEMYVHYAKILFLLLIYTICNAACTWRYIHALQKLKHPTTNHHCIVLLQNSFLFLAYLQHTSILIHVAIIHLFSWLYNVPLEGCPHCILFLYAFRDFFLLFSLLYAMLLSSMAITVIDWDDLGMELVGDKLYAFSIWLDLAIFSPKLLH